MKNTEMVRFLRDYKNRGKVEIITATEVSLNDELKEIATARGIDLSNCDRDFAFFKNVYALTDTANANKCILPKDKIEPVLSSIILKPIDIDHIRSYTIGVYLDANIKDNVIYSYGIIFKANFEEEWEEAKKLFEEGKLTSSFEIWCPADKRTYFEDGTFSLDEPVIAGGAILFKTTPAFKEAQVLEMAKKRMDSNKVVKLDNNLVAASIENIVEEEVITASYSIYDNYEIQNLINQVACPECGYQDWKVSLVDYENKTATANCWYCDLKAGFKLIPDMTVLTANDIYTKPTELTHFEREAMLDTDFAFVKKIDGKKIRMFLTDEKNIENSLKRLEHEKMESTLKKMGVTVDEVKKLIESKFNNEEGSFNCVCPDCGYTETSDKHCKDISCSKCGASMRREGFPGSGNPSKSNKEEIEMEKKIKELEAEVAKMVAEASEKEEAAKVVAEELKEAKESLEASKEEIKTLTEAQEQLSEEAKAQLDAAKVEIETRVEEAKKNATTVAERKAELGEDAKDMSDEDLLNDDKFEIAKLKKEKAALEAKVVEAEAKVVVKTETASVRGVENDEGEEKTELEKSAEKVKKYAWKK